MRGWVRERRVCCVLHAQLIRYLWHSHLATDTDTDRHQVTRMSFSPIFKLTHAPRSPATEDVLDILSDVYSKLNMHMWIVYPRDCDTAPRSLATADVLDICYFLMCVCVWLIQMAGWLDMLMSTRNVKNWGTCTSVNLKTHPCDVHLPLERVFPQGLTFFVMRSLSLQLWANRPCAILSNSNIQVRFWEY